MGLEGPPILTSSGMGPQHSEHNFEWLAVPCFLSFASTSACCRIGLVLGAEDDWRKHRVRLGDENSHVGTAFNTGLHALPMHREEPATRFPEGSEIMRSMEGLSAASCKASLALKYSKDT